MLKHPSMPAAALLAFLVAAPAASAQDDDWCREHGHRDRDRGWHCEVRDFTLRPGGVLRVDGGLNGGIEVEGWDRPDVQVVARVYAWARTDDEARRLVQGVRVPDRGTLRAEGPSTGHRESWGVSYRIYVPRQSDLELETHNGGIRVRDVSGQVQFSALNGGVRLENLSGDIRGHTTNGGLSIELTGTEWRGAGVDVATTNGGVTLRIPEAYNARVETGTVNGGVRVDFPVTVQGNLRRDFAFDLGRGGRTIRARTTNGSVRLLKT